MWEDVGCYGRWSNFLAHMGSWFTKALDGIFTKSFWKYDRWYQYLPYLEQVGFPRPNARSTLDPQQQVLRASIFSAICCCAIDHSVSDSILNVSIVFGPVGTWNGMSHTIPHNCHIITLSYLTKHSNSPVQIHCHLLQSLQHLLIPLTFVHPLPNSMLHLGLPVSHG